jgi:hypothetical protein
MHGPQNVKYKKNVVYGEYARPSFRLWLDIRDMNNLSNIHEIWCTSSWQKIFGMAWTS